MKPPGKLSGRYELASKQDNTFRKGGIIASLDQRRRGKTLKDIDGHNAFEEPICSGSKCQKRARTSKVSDSGTHSVQGRENKKVNRQRAPYAAIARTIPPPTAQMPKGIVHEYIHWEVFSKVRTGRSSLFQKAWSAQVP